MQTFDVNIRKIVPREDLERSKEEKIRSLLHWKKDNLQLLKLLREQEDLIFDDTEMIETLDDLRWQIGWLEKDTVRLNALIKIFQ